MAVISLKGARRSDLGKGGARKARAAGRIPGVVYGHGETPEPVSISARDFELAMLQHKGGNAREEHDEGIHHALNQSHRDHVTIGDVRDFVAEHAFEFTAAHRLQEASGHRDQRPRAAGPDIRSTRAVHMQSEPASWAGT